VNRLVRELRRALDPYAAADARQRPAAVPAVTVPPSRFADAAASMRRAHARLVAEWAVDESPFGRGFAVLACYSWAREWVVVRSDLPPGQLSFPTLSGTYAAAWRFERQVHSLMGLVPEGHPDLRPWVAHEDWPEGAHPLRKSFDGSRPLPRVAGEYPWLRAEGEGVYEIPVGPVHAGIIEPGHFRFQALGEDVLNLEIRLGYVHKGIEKRFEALPWGEGHRLAGRVSGDTTVAHAIGYCLALEALAGAAAPARAHWLRALFLERERVANHLGDLGMIANDAAFAFLLSQFARVKEELLRTNAELFGHRFLMDRVVPGGVAADLGPAGRTRLKRELDSLAVEFERLVAIYDENPSLEDRVRTTGVLAPERALALGAVGFVARASGLNTDARVDFPFPPYDRPDLMDFSVPVLISGDVHARAWVRVEEVRESIQVMRFILEHIPEGPTAAPIGAPAPDTCGLSAVEGWRGEIVYWLQAGPGGGVNRIMVRDPSAVNWTALEQALPGNIVPDFPLCNKSFNQSYSGHDL